MGRSEGTKNKGGGGDGKKGKVHKAEVAYWMVGKEGSVLVRKRSWWWVPVGCFVYKGINFPFSCEFSVDIGLLIVHWTPRGCTPRFWHFYINFLMRIFNFSIVWGRVFFSLLTASLHRIIFFLFPYFSIFLWGRQCGCVHVTFFLFSSIGAFIFASLLQLVLGLHL